MVISGHVQNGVVVLDGGRTLPEGQHVFISVPPQPSASSTTRVTLPLIPSQQPGLIDLTAERVAELLDEGDVSS